MRRLLILVSVTIALIGLTPIAAQATIFTVTRFDDPAPDGCAAMDCSLREAVLDANATTDLDTIVLVTGTYTLSIPGTDEAASANGDLDITEDVIIEGTGQGTTTIDGNGGVTSDRVLQIPTDVDTIDATIRDLTITGGNSTTLAQKLGAAFLNQEHLVLERVVVTGNTAASAGFAVVCACGTDEYLQVSISGNLVGGGVHSVGATTITDSTIDDNDFVGFNMNGGAATLRRVTVSGNDGTGVSANSGPTTLENVTISGNQSTSNGGGLWVGSAGTANANAVTIAENTADSDAGAADGDGGGVFNDGGTLNLENSIVAGNSDASPSGNVHPDCSGTVNSLGQNLIQDTTGCTIAGDVTGNITGQDPLLGPLADNGGPTLTRALLSGSPAIDAADAATAPATDQRGFPRNPPPDIGAFEVQPGTPLAKTAKTLTLKAKPKRVDPGARTRLTAQITPCDATTKNDVVEFRKGSKVLGEKAVDEACSARMKRRMRKRTSFGAFSAEDADSQEATSNRVKVRVKPD
jgi:CSLREA domain-containing protein